MTYNEQHRNHYNCLGLYYAMRFLLSLVCCFFLLQFAFRRNETVILFFFSSELIFFFICIQHRFQWVICMNYALLCLNDLFDRLDNTIFLLLLFFFSSFFYLCVELVEFGDCASRSNFFLQIFSSEIPSPKILTIFFFLCTFADSYVADGSLMSEKRREIEISTILLSMFPME